MWEAIRDLSSNSNKNVKTHDPESKIKIYTRDDFNIFLKYQI